MKKILIFIIFGMLLISLFESIQAQEINPPETTTQSPFSFSSWFKNTFGIQQFSVVGDSRRCSIQPDNMAIVGKGAHFSASASKYCSSGYALFDVFSPDWNPYKEYANNVDITCGANGNCNIQVYCCDHPECSSDSQCQSWVGTYSTCKTASCVSWNGGYKCTTDYGTETNIPYCQSSFKYCSQNIYKDCYYISGSSCIKHTYPGMTSCPSSYQGATLYSSLLTCRNNICMPATCASLGKNCGTASDGCGGTLTCGTCASGSSCNENNYCQSTNVTSPLCTTGAIYTQNVTCSMETLNSCNIGACPSGYTSGIIDSCGFHSCILINQTSQGTNQAEQKTFDINAIAFPIGTFNVSWVMLIIGFIILIILIRLIK